jgi:cytidine deaminase
MHLIPWISSLRWCNVFYICQSIVVGVSGGVSFYLLTKLPATINGVGTSSSRDRGERLKISQKISNAIENMRMHICCCTVPVWICVSISLPIVFSVSSKTTYRERFLLWAALGSHLIVLSQQDREKSDSFCGKDDRQPLLRDKGAVPLKNIGEEETLRNDSEEEFPKEKIFKTLIEKNSLVYKAEEKYQRNSALQGCQRFLEVLVHNVSHSDIVLGLDVTDVADMSDKQHEGVANVFDWKNICLARPRFSSFDRYSRLILEQMSLVDTSAHTVVFLPRHQRTLDDPRYLIQEFPMSELPPSPAGIQLSDNRVCTFNRTSLQHELKVRSKDSEKLDQFIRQQRSSINIKTGEMIRENKDELNPAQDEFTIKVSHAIFPFLATLLPVWEQFITGKKYSHDSCVKRVLILVTGVGTPRNMEHAIAGNSTEHLGKILQNFIQRIDPNLTVVQIHSNTNVFRYDENLVFAERELIPTINAYRDALATGSAYPDEIPKESGSIKSTNESTRMNVENVCLQNFSERNWRQFMSLTLSFACGSPARTTAIQASLRHFKPVYYHFWQLKTFWHEQKIVDDDIEIQSFEAMMETSPAQDAEEVQDVHILSVVKEMKAFQGEIALILSGSSDQHDLYRFWLRKTHKLVLAVLLVQSSTMKAPQLFRGTNMEVSMPTGSLCAERNVIGSALSQFPSLKRQDLKVIAVLAVPPMDTGSTEEVCYEIPRSLSYASQLDAALAGHGQLSRKFSLGSENEVLFRDRGKSDSIGSEQDGWCLAPIHQDVISQTNNFVVSNIQGVNQSSGSSTPVRRIPLFSGNVAHIRNPKRTVLVQSNVDMNPLRPCGACNEWLKKIAESNPYFRIVTFTDACCKGIYVSSCQD